MWCSCWTVQEERLWKLHWMAFVTLRGRIVSSAGKGRSCCKKCSRLKDRLCCHCADSGFFYFNLHKTVEKRRDFGRICRIHCYRLEGGRYYDPYKRFINTLHGQRNRSHICSHYGCDQFNYKLSQREGLSYHDEFSDECHVYEQNCGNG